MAIDIKFIQDSNGNWDIDFENGDFKLTDGLDTALYLSIFGEKRATKSEVVIPELRRGHFTNEFSSVEGYEIGNTSWIEIDQEKITDANISLIENKWIQGLNWMVEDKIIKELNITIDAKGSILEAEINITNNTEQDSSYYNMFINTFL